MQNFIKAKWGGDSTVQVSQLKPGVILYKFVSGRERDIILDLGHWTFDNRPLVLRHWSPNENYSLESVASLPVWVRFPNLATHLRRANILSLITSTVGRPLRSDGFTTRNEKLMYVRVLIEVLVANEFKKSVLIEGPNVVNFVQKIVYEWTPPRSCHCQSFGHSIQTCRFPRIRMEEGEDENDRVVLEPGVQEEPSKWSFGFYFCHGSPAVRKKAQKKKKVKTISDNLELNMSLVKLSHRVKGNGWNKGGAFKAVIKGQRTRNRISSIKVPDGNISFDSNQIRVGFLEHFKNILTGSFVGSPVGVGLFEEGPKVDEAECVLLSRQVTMDEVVSVLKKMSTNTATGPDGFSVEFFKASKNMCGKDILELVRQFFRDGRMPKGITSTYLALILKVNNPNAPYEYKPISCCNIIYKIISSILASRLRLILPRIIGESQSAFITGRNIVDNISLAQEVMSSYSRKNISGRCAIKVDIDDVLIFAKANRSSILAVKKAWDDIFCLVTAGSVLKKIITVCRSFLWTGNVMGNKSLIAWNQVCQNQSDGGLGIKNLGLFNVALNLLQFWDICKKKDSVWIKWLHNYYFSNVNVWDMVEKNYYSWQLKMILRLRSMAEKCVTVSQGGVLSWKGVYNCFQCKGSYDLLKNDIQEKLWAELVWADLSPPKHCFCAGLAIKNMLQTRDRMVLEGDIDRR
ncbi:hypothetical protein QQ045_031182 [Rhodiola kirilowii]